MSKSGIHPFQLWLAGTTLAVGLGALFVIPEFVEKERFGQLSEMTSKNAVLGRLWLTSQIGEWKATLKAARRSHMAAGSEAAAAIDYKDFTGFVALTQVGVEPWQVAWSEKTSAFEFDSSLSDSAFLQELVAGLKSDGEASGETDGTNKAFFHWIPNGSKAVAVAILENPLVSVDGTKRTQVALVGFLPQTSLDAATRFFRGGISELSVLNRNGVIFADSDRSLVGEILPSSPLSDRVLRGKNPSFEGVLGNDSKEDFQVSSEAVSASNLIVLAKTPTIAVSKATQTIKMVLIGIFGGLIFFMLLIGRAFIEGVRRKINQLMEMASNPTTERSQKLRTRLNRDADWVPLMNLVETRADVTSELEPTQGASAPTSTAIPNVEQAMTETLSAKVELESLEQAGQYIAQCLREPIAASIGHLKLAKGKTVEIEATKHLEHVETEVRRIKELVEKVQKLGVYKALQTRPADVSGVMRDLMDDIVVMAETVGVKVRKSLYPVPKARIANQDFREAIKVLIQERVLASQAQGKNELVVGVEPSGSQVVIRIEDRCSSMSTTEKENFFRPLSQSGSYDHQHQKMLAILNYHDLKIRFDAATTDGNLLIIELPAIEEAMVEAAPTLPPALGNSESTADLWELSKNQNQFEGIPDLNSTLDFLETKSLEQADSVVESGSRKELSPAVEPQERVITGPLSEYSVKVRKPRLNVPLE